MTKAQLSRLEARALLPVYGKGAKSIVRLVWSDADRDAASALMNRLKAVYVGDDIHLGPYAPGAKAHAARWKLVIETCDRADVTVYRVNRAEARKARTARLKAEEDNKEE
jgi:hypothetical protein